MTNFLHSIFSSFSTYSSFLQGILIILLGPFSVHLGLKISSFFFKNLQSSYQVLLEKFIKYFLNTIFIIWGLKYFGIDLKVLLGAAGIFTVAIGFASQTSASNLISGLFLLTERPFSIGDTLRVGDITGIILSIDLFSTRLRTFDNILIRIPNETLMKSNIQNITYFPLRRIDFELQLPLEQSSFLPNIEQCFFSLCENKSTCLEDPKPMFLINGIKNNYLQIQLSFWSLQNNIPECRYKMAQDLGESLKDLGVTLPYFDKII